MNSIYKPTQYTFEPTVHLLKTARWDYLCPALNRMTVSVKANDDLLSTYVA